MSRSSGTISRRHSSPVLKEGDLIHLGLPNFQPERKQSEIPTIPPAPVIQPKRLPSIPEPPRSGWRLSFVSNGNRDKPSQEYKLPIHTTVEETSMSGPTLRRWLHGQGLRSSSNPILGLDDNDTDRNLSNPSGSVCTASHDVAGVDGGIENNVPTIHLHEMGISHRLASRNLMTSPSSPQLTSWGSETRAGSSSDTSLVRIERSRFLRNTSDSMALSDCIPQSWGNVLQGQTSSLYPSNGNSIQPSAGSSRFNLASVLASSMNSPTTSEVDSKPYPSCSITLKSSTLLIVRFQNWSSPT